MGEYPLISLPSLSLGKPALSRPANRLIQVRDCGDGGRVSLWFPGTAVPAGKEEQP